MDFSQFQQMHGAQLERVPRHYWEALHEKLESETYDAGRYFTMCPVEEGEEEEGGWKVVMSNEHGLKVDNSASVYLVDHAWTLQLSSAQEQLLQVPGLAARMATLMDLGEGGEEGGGGEGGGGGGGGGYEADSESGDEKDAWSHDDSEGEVESATRQADQSGATYVPSAQDGYRSGDLADESHACVQDSDSASDAPNPVSKQRYRGADDLRSPLEELHIAPDKPLLEDLDDETDHHVGSRHALACSEPTNQNTAEEGLVPPSEELVARILERMWRYCHAYSINNSAVPIWYIMDEFGSRIRQSCDPTISMTTLFYIPLQFAFTVLWPIKDLDYGDEATCNFLPEVVKPGLETICHSLPWSHDHHLTSSDPVWSHLDEFKVPEFEERCNEELPASPSHRHQSPSHPHQAPSSPSHLHHPPPSPSHPHHPPPSPLKVYTDIKLVQSYLKHPLFSLTPSRGRADILWLAEHFKEFRSLRPGQFINQFPCENVVTCKDLLATVAKRACAPGTAEQPPPPWLPLTFNLLYELPHLVHCFLKRKEEGEANVWIVKPWNLGRGLDIFVTDNLQQIVRLAQAGPKVASRYITDPVLFLRPEIGWVKFDVRYIVLLVSAAPLVLYVYDVFWLRFANKPFSLDDFWDYEKHFTVMNYKEGVSLEQIHYDDFIPLFEDQYPQHCWRDIQADIFSMLKQLFTAACSAPPPAGIAPSSQCRAIYGVDLMLEWNAGAVGGGSARKMSPQLVEVNYSPDCVRACKYHPHFYTHIFEVLFSAPENWSHDPPVTRLL